MYFTWDLMGFTWDSHVIPWVSHGFHIGKYHGFHMGIYVCFTWEYTCVSHVITWDSHVITWDSHVIPWVSHGFHIGKYHGFHMGIYLCDEWGGPESRGNGARPVELMMMSNTCTTHRSRVPMEELRKDKRRSDDSATRERTRPGL